MITKNQMDEILVLALRVSKMKILISKDVILYISVSSSSLPRDSE
jgi:hypothetical protein